MTKTIGMLWGGELSPCQYFGMFNAKMRQQNHLVQDALDKLEKTLGENQKELLHQYCDSMERYNFTAAEQAFCDGFCMGTRLTSEALIGAEKII